MASGRPDWYGTIVTAGKYDSQYIAIAVDANGNIVGVMKGDDAGTLRTIAVDSNGMMQANLSAQDLDFLTVRPAYGQAKRDVNTTTVPDSTLTSLVSVSGEGVILGGIFRVFGAADRSNVRLDIKVDGTDLVTRTFTNMFDDGVYAGVDFPAYLIQQDVFNFYHVMALRQGTTFETSLQLLAYHEYGVNQDVYHNLVYALTP